MQKTNIEKEQLRAKINKVLDSHKENEKRGLEVTFIGDHKIVKLTSNESFIIGHEIKDLEALGLTLDYVEINADRKLVLSFFY